MEKHKPGEMDISVQTHTFEGFIKGIIYVCIFCVAVLLLALAAENHTFSLQFLSNSFRDLRSFCFFSSFFHRGLSSLLKLHLAKNPLSVVFLQRS